MHAFVTVGSTKFDALVTETLSLRMLTALRDKGYASLTVQCGNSTFVHSSSIAKGETASLTAEGVMLELWKFKPSLREEYEKADLIVSHAGSGTIIEILRLPKPLIVIPNPTLLHNHQEELAKALESQGFLKSSTIQNLAQDIRVFEPKNLNAFPDFDGSRFRKLMDEEMGFI